LFCDTFCNNLFENSFLVAFKTSSTTINEKAGDLNYLSFYTPLFDNKKEIIGFIN
jgi:hypothetical protein